LDLSRLWQDTGVPAEAVEAGRPDALSNSARGQGEAVELAADLIWRFGLPEPPSFTAPPDTGSEAGPERLPGALPRVPGVGGGTSTAERSPTAPAATTPATTTGP